MRILYFYQYFSTPKGSWGTRVYDFAKEWVKDGHQVSIVTSIYSKSDLRATKFVENQIIEGINLIVLNIKIDNKQNLFKRIWTFIQYAFMSSWYALVLPADLVIASSGPITVGLPGLVARYLRGRKLVFETRDLWPEGAIEIGIIRNNLIKKLAYWFESCCYKGSSLIVSLSPGMQEYIKTKHHHSNVISVTNSANIELFSSPLSKPNIKTVDERKYAIYSGNIGKVNNSRLLLNTAKVLKDKNRSDIVILLVGEGQWREELEIEGRNMELDNFIIQGLIPKIELVGIVQHAIASLVPLSNAPILATSSPNKFFESLAAGVPVIQNTNGWMKEFLSKHNIGFTVDHNDPVSLANILIKLVDQPELLEEIKPRATAVAANEFDKNKLASKMLSSMVKLFES